MEDTFKVKELIAEVASLTAETQLSLIARTLAEEYFSAGNDALLGQFYSELALEIAKIRQRQDRKEIQARGIAAAKDRGVKFGAGRKPLPENFPEAYAAYRAGELSLRAAAESCGMPSTSFHTAVRRYEEEHSETLTA